MTMEGEDDWAASEPVRACQVPVPDDGRRTIRLVVGGDGVGGGTWDDDFWGDNGWVDSDNPEEAAEGEEAVGETQPSMSTSYLAVNQHPNPITYHSLTPTREPLFLILAPYRYIV
eukprot:CAMPEP_0198704758 /NCGR_PEP_ID=MMETSP1468-20131203/390073_1 /TAXON_ID=1461545 /ORGANISM="Mantoniella sp, Strain CCMP1436" /LENGTH=114 /DNA_ID=CAMNT_0044463591 /DNA_START=506 /DNA_END=850 /DNA_ORIENTATION=-